MNIPADAEPAQHPSSLVEKNLALWGRWDKEDRCRRLMHESPGSGLSSSPFWCFDFEQAI
jgi:hypothetical protein